MLISENIMISASRGLQNLEQWLENNGWAGYDPYDLRGSKPFRQLLALPGGKYPAYAIERFSPMAARKVLGVRPEINAKGMGLLALGYLKRFQTTRSADYQEKAQDCLKWLEDHMESGYSGACWGYPFDWQSRIFIPRGTPSSVVSSICGWAFLDAYRILDDPHYLDVAAHVADFLVNDLNIDRVSDTSICFSYTPLDTFHVHNANLFVAAHLGEVSHLTGNPQFAKLAEHALAYTLNDQNSEGSWNYWGPSDSISPAIDHYHTGFVLRCLDRLRKVFHLPVLEQAITEGLQFYVRELFDSCGLPKLTPKDRYPIDIHSCAEAILCLTQLSNEHVWVHDQLNSTERWTLDHMQAIDGHFYYRKYEFTTTRIPYLRWGQAWMFWALAAFVDKHSNKDFEV